MLLNNGFCNCPAARVVVATFKLVLKVHRALNSDKWTKSHLDLADEVKRRMIPCARWHPKSYQILHVSKSHGAGSMQFRKPVLTLYPLNTILLKCEALQLLHTVVHGGYRRKHNS